MAIPAYMTIIGEKKGEISKGALSALSVGRISQEDLEDFIQVVAFNHEIVVPRDPQSGQPTGLRVHRPLRITKVVDKCSPILLEAMTAGERLKEVSIEWFRNTAQGGLEHYYTTTLTDALMVSIRDYMHNTQDESTSHFSHLEDIEFSYGSIKWEHKLGSTMGQDEWKRPPMVTEV